MLIIFLDLYLKKANTRVMVLSLAYAILASSYEFSNMMQPYLLVYMQAAEMKKRPLQKLKQRIRKITPMCHMLHVFP